VRIAPRCIALVGTILLVGTGAVVAYAAVRGGSSPDHASASPPSVSVCGTSLCVDGTRWSMYGATVYNPGLKPYLSGVKNPARTIALARQAHLNTIRLTNLYNNKGDVATAPFNETAWRFVDAMIAAAGSAGMHIDLGLADYRNILWNKCINPYTAKWRDLVSFVANRINTVSHRIYKNDPTIAFVSVAGEPLPVGTHRLMASATGQPCSITYSTSDLTSFYASVTAAWKQQGGRVVINTGGLGYLNEPKSGIDWKAIFSLSTNAFCDIKTYGGMQAWAPTAVDYCRKIGKPVIDEEFGWRQQLGDSQRAHLFAQALAELRSEHVAGLAFWNLGYELAPGSFEVNPSTPLTFSVIQRSA
jgi:hypothetical protein